jgi:hypothetical protein
MATKEVEENSYEEPTPNKRSTKPSAPANPYVRAPQAPLEEAPRPPPLPTRPPPLHRSRDQQGSRVPNSLVRSFRYYPVRLLNEGDNTRSRRRGNQSRSNSMPSPSIITNVVTICCFIVGSYSAQAAHSDLRSINAKAYNCHHSSSNSEFECKYTEVLELEMIPGEKAELMLLSPDNKALSSVEVHLMEAAFGCERVSLSFTRDFVSKVQSTGVCSGKGSCMTPTQCSSIQANSLIPELVGVANDSPGRSHCMPRCGCPWCGGCWSCSTGCAFSRQYAVPVDNDVHELIKCQGYSANYVFNITTTTGQKVDSYILKMKSGRQGASRGPLTVSAGEPETLRNILPTNKYLISNGRAALVEPEEESGLVIRCPTYEDASLFKCSMWRDPCVCEGNEDQRQCTCIDKPISAIYQHNPLPINSEHLHIHAHEGTIKAQMLSGQVPVKLRMENLKISTTSQDYACSVSEVSAQGCFSCTAGSEIHLKCTSEGPIEQVYVKCDTVGFRINCSPFPEIQSIHMRFQNAIVNERCVVECPKNRHEFTIEALLNYVQPKQVDNNLITTGTIWRGGEAPKDDTNIFTDAFSWAVSSWKNAFISLGIIVVGAIAIAATTTGCVIFWWTLCMKTAQHAGRGAANAIAQ